MVTGEVKLFEKMEENLVPLDLLGVGEGIVSRDGVRLKTGHRSYLHFTISGFVLSNCAANWPPITGRVGKFRLVAEEI